MLVYLLTLWAIAGAVEIGSTHETQSGAEVRSDGSIKAMMRREKDPDESDEASDENDPSGSESSDDSPSSLSSSNTSATANASATANTSATANSTAAINSTADANSTALANATKHSVSDSQEKSDADMDASDEETSGTESSEKAESESSESTEAADKESTDNKEDSSESAESSTDNPSDTADSTDSKTQSTDGSTEADGKTESADSQADSADSQADTETSETESEGSEDTQEGSESAAFINLDKPGKPHVHHTGGSKDHVPSHHQKLEPHPQAAQAHVKTGAQRAKAPKTLTDATEHTHKTRKDASLISQDPGTTATTTYYFTLVSTNKYCANAESGYKKNVGNYQMKECFEYVLAEKSCGKYFDFGVVDGACDCVPQSHTECQEADAENYHVYLIQKGGPEALIEVNDEGMALEAKGGKGKKKGKSGKKR